MLDPGFGFGKSPEQNLEILARLDELNVLGFPLLVGTSRKSFIGKVTGRESDERLVGTLVTSVVAALAGAAILRVHDVAEHVEAMRMTAAIRAAGTRPGRRLDRRRPRARRKYRRSARSHERRHRGAVVRARQSTVDAVSALYRTPPWGKTDQPAFLNAAVRIETQLSPQRPA